jgi:DNA-binding NarL/FixJ family response regulator
MREQQILPLLLDGKSNKEVAGQIGATERTVKFHVHNILAKYNVTSRLELLVQAYRLRR